MKKTYILPVAEALNMSVEIMIAGSIKGVDGDTGIGLAGPSEGIPGDGDSKANPFGESIFD